MKKIIPFLFLLIITFAVKAEPKYIKTFGKKESPAVIFLHGGPGYNSANFETTTAKNLAAKGYYVIVYDRDGEGRSENKDAKYTFQDAISELNGVYAKYGIKEAILIGHGFGGMLATKYAEKFSSNVKALILINTPLSMQDSYKSIIKKASDIYDANNDSTGIALIKKINNMDSTSIEYSSNSFSAALINGFFSPKNPTEEALKLYEQYRTDSNSIKLAYQYVYEAQQGFLMNDKYTTMNISESLKKLVEAKMRIFGFYGQNDGQITAAEVEKIKAILGKDNVRYMESCSYNAFIDQQTPLFEALAVWTK